MLHFRPLTMEDKGLVQSYTLDSYHSNCDLCFMNLMSWRFYYNTEVAEWEGHLIFRFYVNNHFAYLAPLGKGEWRAVIEEMRADAARSHSPFVMYGVTERTLTYLNAALPDYFYATADRDYSDYIYEREKLATLAGKKLQAKRNHIHQFLRHYPHYDFLPLTPADIQECLDLERLWSEEKPANSSRTGYLDERRSMQYVFQHWEQLGGLGATLRVDGQLIAFTFGAPINRHTFDVCVEKADTRYEGAYTLINREFVRSLPPQYLYINREEDLGISGLRQAKTSYRPDILLHKYTVMEKHPFKKD